MRWTILFCLLFSMSPVAGQSLTVDSEALKTTEGLRAEKSSTEAAGTDAWKRDTIYILVTLGLVSLLRFYLVFGPRFINRTDAIHFLGLMALTLSALVAYLWVQHLFTTRQEQSWLLIPIAIVATALLALAHARLERWTVRKLEQKNKRIRLAAAKRTINTASSQ